MPKNNRLIIPVWADIHGGYSFGLCPPDIRLPALDDSNGPWSPDLTATQEQLYSWALKDLEEITHLADGAPMFGLVLGDVTQGSFLSDQLLCVPRLSDQIQIGKEVLEMFFGLPGMVGGRLIKGTGVHVMKHGSSELIIADQLKDKFPELDLEAWYHSRLDINGVVIDAAHHGPNSGSRDWLKGNSLRYYTRSIMNEDIKAGKRPPHIILRGHYHDRTFEVVHEHLKNGKTLKTFAAIAPAYSLFTDDYTIKVTKSKGYMTAGTIAFEIIDGQVKDIYDFTHTIDIRKQEVIKI